MSFSGESSNGALNMTQLGHATYSSPTAAAAATPLSDASKPAVMSDSVQEVAMLAAADPAAYAIWLHCEQMKRQVLADSAQYLCDDSLLQVDDSPHPPTPADGSLANAKRVPQQTYFPGGVSPYSQYMQSGQPLGFENTLNGPYMPGLQGTGISSLSSMPRPRPAVPEYSSRENVIHLCSLAEQTMAAATGFGQIGYPGYGKHVEGKEPDCKQRPNLIHHSCVNKSPTMHCVCTHER